MGVSLQDFAPPFVWIAFEVAKSMCYVRDGSVA